MSEKSAIEWTDDTWNVTLGCSKVSPGCKHCYAINHVHRMAGNPNPKIRAANEGLTVIEGGHPNWNGEIRLIPERLEIPLRKRKPTRYFVNALSDLFHEGLLDEAIDRVWQVMLDAPQHTYQILTKRAQRMQNYMTGETVGGRAHYRNAPDWIWLGVSVEDQANADLRIPHLLQTPAAVRFLSVEPLLGPVDLYQYLGGGRNPIGPAYGGRGVDWVIAGGESGPGARPCDLTWIRSIVEQCKAARVPVFVKQLGAKPCAQWTGEGDGIWNPGTLGAFDAQVANRWIARLRDRKGGSMEEWPSSLRVRQMPASPSGSAVGDDVADGVSP